MFKKTHIQFTHSIGLSQQAFQGSGARKIISSLHFEETEAYILDELLGVTNN